MIEIELPLPPKACSPNRRGHWRSHADGIAAYRAQTANDYRLAKIGALKTPVKMHLDFYLARTAQAVYSKRYFPKDADNARASFKAGQDAMQEAGLVPGDSKRYVVPGETNLFTTKKQHKGRSCVVVRFEEQP